MRAGSGQAPSGQQCALWCSCDLASAARARSLTAWEMVEHAWHEFTGGWTAVCDRFGSCWPCWAPGEDLERLPALGSECGCVFSCSYCCTVRPRVVTLSVSAGNDVDMCTPGREGAAAEATPDFSILTPPTPQPDYRPQRLPPPRLQGEGCASVGCTRRTQALRPNRAQRREAQRQQRRTRRWASRSERRRVPVGSAREVLEGRLWALPLLARKRRVAMWKRRWSRDRRRRAGVRGCRDGAAACGPDAGCGVEGGTARPQAREQARPQTFWDKVWAVPIRIWNALMRAYYGNKLPPFTAETAVLMAFNVDGKMRLRGTSADTEDWGNGVDLKAEATADWKRVLDMMEGRALVVLSDLCVSGRQLTAMINRIQRDTSFLCFGTPGPYNATTGQRSAGVLVAWHKGVYLAEAKRVLRSGRLVEVRLQDLLAQQALTVFGAYMPGRALPERQVAPVWDALEEAVSEAGPGRIIMGDLNAELTTALLREARDAQLADERLQHLCGEECLVTAGPDQATYQSNGRSGVVRSQIDHILCDGYAARMLGESEVLAGLSEHDHRIIEAGLFGKWTNMRGQSDLPSCRSGC